MGLSVIAVLAGRENGRAPVNWWGVLLMVAVGTVLVLGVVGMLVRLAGVDAEATEIAAALTTDPDQQRLIERWLERARWARFVGGFSGVLVWALATYGQGDVLLLGTAGIAAGALSAEVHHLRRPGGPRTADLTVRALRDYLDQPAAIGMAVALIVGSAVATVGIVTEHRTATMLGLGATVVVALGIAAQRRIVSRSRPAIPDRLRRADDLTRRLAISRGIALPVTYVALAMAAGACRELADEPHLGVFGLIGVVIWMAAFGLWWRNRRLGLTAEMFREPERAPTPA